MLSSRDKDKEAIAAFNWQLIYWARKVEKWTLMYETRSRGATTIHKPMTDPFDGGIVFHTGKIYRARKPKKYTAASNDTLSVRRRRLSKIEGNYIIEYYPFGFEATRAHREKYHQAP